MCKVSRAAGKSAEGHKGINSLAGGHPAPCTPPVSHWQSNLAASRPRMLPPDGAAVPKDTARVRVARNQECVVAARRGGAEPLCTFLENCLMQCSGCTPWEAAGGPTLYGQQAALVGVQASWCCSVLVLQASWCCSVIVLQASWFFLSTLMWH